MIMLNLFDSNVTMEKTNSNLQVITSSQLSCGKKKLDQPYSRWLASRSDRWRLSGANFQGRRMALGSHQPNGHPDKTSPIPQYSCSLSQNLVDVLSITILLGNYSSLHAALLNGSGPPAHEQAWHRRICNLVLSRLIIWLDQDARSDNKQQFIFARFSRNEMVGEGDLLAGPSKSR
jgi:hypothetical protein